jgi:purine-cytosine permease-like protein
MKNPLCKYKNILGEPGKGFHSYRALGVSILDVLVVLLAAIGISYWTKISAYIIVPGMFLLGIVVHRMFCVRTTVDKLLFP